MANPAKCQRNIASALSLPQRLSAIAAAELMSVTRLTIPVRRLLRIICAITSRKT
jgi:hypothetical protein